MFGSITTPQLSIDRGVLFEGQSQTTKTPDPSRASEKDRGSSIGVEDFFGDALDGLGVASPYNGVRVLTVVGVVALADARAVDQPMAELVNG